MCVVTFHRKPFQKFKDGYFIDNGIYRSRVSIDNGIYRSCRVSTERVWSGNRYTEYIS